MRAPAATLTILAAAAWLTLATAAAVHAQGSASRGVPSTRHPAIYLLDKDGENVLASRAPVSTMRTCGDCHDTEYIATHSYHATLGFDEFGKPGSVQGGRPWDMSPGLFGRWNPIVYRHLSAEGDDRLDLGTADWVRICGELHAGGGPAVLSRSGVSLKEIGRQSRLQTQATGEARGVAPRCNPEACVFDEASGAPIRWDWEKSGVVEFNCFVCHLDAPANEARTRELALGRFKWAATATLERTGLVVRSGGQWQYRGEVFESDGSVPAERLPIVPPSSDHCGGCHGLVHSGDDPVIPSYGLLSQSSTETKGQIFSAQRLFLSGMNLAGKDTLSRPWDIHAERMVGCAGCHFALNDPSYGSRTSGLRPAHLAFDARRLEIGEFLRRPDHNLAKGRSAQGTVSNALDGTMRRCEDCHEADSTHDWLPYKKRHMDRVLCESCHIPLVNAPARRVTDWTVLTSNGGPRVEYRGVSGSLDDPAALVNGYRPVLMPREGVHGELPKLAPHNLIVSWFWVSSDPPRPVRSYDLRRAFFREGSYDPEVLEALDTDGDGDIGPGELLLDTPQKVNAIRRRLEALGLKNPRITGELQPYSLHHGVVSGTWATRECMTCHSKSSKVLRPFVLASAAPGGVIPAPVGDSNARMTGEIALEEGQLHYKPATMQEGYYVIGHDRSRGVDIAGILVMAGVLVGALIHGGSRLYISRTRRGQ